MAEDDIKCTYVRVARRLWIDERLRRVSEDARMLFMYLLTSPHGNMVGYYRLPAAYACSDLQWPMDRWSQALTELTKGVGDGPMVMYDAGSEVVLVRNYLRYNPIENRNQAIGATKTLVELPGNTLWPEFVAAVHRHAAKFTEPFTERFGERFAKGYGNPVTVTVTVTEAVTVTGTVPASRAGADAPESVLGSQDPTLTENPDQEPVAPDSTAMDKNHDDQPRFVMDFYNEVFRDLWKSPLQLTSERRRLIKARLKKHSVAELCEAIRTIRASPFHCGQNDAGTVYATPEFILRNDSKVDEWLKKQVISSDGNQLCRGNPTGHRGHKAYTEGDGYDWDKLAR